MGEDRGSKETDGCPLTASLSAHTSTASDRPGTGPCDATAPSAITWTTIYGRLGTGRLGTAFLCISL
jgi:hypothetical protein